MNNTILIPEMKYLHAIKSQIKTLDEDIKIKRMEFEESIADKTEKLARLKEDFQYASKARFEAGNPIDEKYLIIESHRTVRSVNSDRFREKYPLLFNEIAMVPVKKAEESVGKANLDPLCDLKVSDSVYDIGVISLKKPDPEKVKNELPVIRCID
jgi:hypothetical protein